MSTGVISQSGCSSIQRRPVFDVMVERLAHRLLAWSERPVRARRQIDGHRVTRRIEQRSATELRPVRWY